MQLESDLKLDRLETFLRRLNNKGNARSHREAVVAVLALSCLSPYFLLS